MTTAWWRYWKDSSIARGVLLDALNEIKNAAYEKRLKQEKLTKTKAMEIVGWERYYGARVLKGQFAENGGDPVLCYYGLADAVGLSIRDFLPDDRALYICATNRLLREHSRILDDRHVKAYVEYHCAWPKPAHNPIDVHVVRRIYEDRLKNDFTDATAVEAAIERAMAEITKINLIV